MSSLLQFSGRIKGGKVGLLFQVVRKVPWHGIEREINEDNFTCSQCGKEHPNVYEAFRTPAGMFGPWVIFRYNGEKHVPDLSIPISVEVLPKGARKLSQDDAQKYWHS